MRFLCLHGSGTRGEILAMQLSSLRQRVGERDHTFDFWDGPIASQAGPGVAPFIDPPYYVWYQNAFAQEVRTAAERLLKRIGEQAQPYDAVIGFSQGVAVLTAALILCQTERPNEPLPFKGAMFFSGGIPPLFLETYMPVSQQAIDLVTTTYHELNQTSIRNAKKLETMLETGSRLELWDHNTLLWNGEDEISRDPWMLPPINQSDVWGLDVSNLPCGVRLDVPVVVIYGHKDPMAPFHLQLAMLCHPEKRLVYDHHGGHEIPRTPKVVSDLVRGFAWLKEKIAQS